ncbi:patatin-like phospholipase family protein [uncultured Draconibacterium sp.]|uniref:patatin-like phospholipase family protein n=1 Tax=uncultured Draconibacterium sp. TaxID=1573823 RepID=UPI0032167A4B
MNNNKHINSGFILLFTLVFFAFSSHAQNDSLRLEKPKIGLVLSGGGAKGLAHVGVIKVLEEAGIKPDIITGTSMGSIVGSLYAAGYSVDELSWIVKNANWPQLLTDDENLRMVTMLEKRESKKYTFEIPIKEKKINLPAGLIEGQHLETYFSELFWPLSSQQNFDSLPIPFHCMSVDIISGKVVEHSSGDLVKSIRASMSIPTVFSPVHLDSMLLIDGGVIRNFPVQEAINMGADVIIGVYVGYPENIKANEITSMTDILQRSIALAGIVDAREQNPKCDILIVPDLDDFSASDFTKGEAIQQVGENSARLQMKEIKALAKRLDLKLRAVPKISQPKHILISDIEVENLQFLDKEDVIERSGIEKGDSVTFDNIKEAIDYMYGTRYYSKLTYSLKKSEDADGYILVFQVKENPRSMFNFTPNYDDDLGVGMVMNLTLRNMLLPASRFLMSVNVAENPGFSMLLDKKFGQSQRLSDQFFLNTRNYKLPFYEKGERLGNYKHGFFDVGYGIYYAPGLNHHFGAKGFFRSNKLTPKSDLQSIYPEANFKKHLTKEWGYTVFYKLNSTDNLYFPKKGMKLEVLFTHAASTSAKMELKTYNPEQQYFVGEVNSPYATLSLSHNWYKTFAERFTYNFGLGAGLNTDNPGTYGIFMLGGTQFEDQYVFKNFTGYNFAEVYAYNYSFIKSGLNVELASGLYLSGTVNAGNFADTYDDLFANFTHHSLTDYYWGYNIGLKFLSVIGPVQLLVSDNNKDSKTRFHFSVGFPF